MANYYFEGECRSDTAILSRDSLILQPIYVDADSILWFRDFSSISSQVGDDLLVVSFTVRNTSGSVESTITTNIPLKDCTSLGPIDVYSHWDGIYSLELCAALIAGTWLVWGMAFLGRTSWRIFS